jgi:hypothetical protein
MAEVESYPLHWPAWVPRTSSSKIAWSQFSVTPGKAQRELFEELRRLGARGVIVSTNVAVRRDGRPYAKPPRITDAGVAVYFSRNGVEQVIACDRYREVWENIRAIGLTIERLRSIERYGTSQMVDAAFWGFAAQPETTTAGGDWTYWWLVLGVEYDTEREVIDRAYRHLAREHHPDRGGDPERFRQITEAYRRATSTKAHR